MATYGYQQIPWTGNTAMSYTGCTDTVNTWQYWNATGTTATAGSIWNTWTSGTSTIAFQTAWNGWWNAPPNVQQNPYYAPPRVLTPEQMEALEEADRIVRAQAEERMARERIDAAEAAKRAEELLCSQLRPGQRRMLRERDHFYVRSQHGRRYEIARGHHQNVYEVDGKGKRLKSFCIYASGGVPHADSMLAQKLHLEMNEDHFLQVAHPMVLPRGT